MPQMRATMSGTSWNGRPSSNFSNSRGGSKMRSFRSWTVPPRTVNSSAPSPSTRTSSGTLMRVSRSSATAALSCLQPRFEEGRGGVIDEVKTGGDILPDHSKAFEPAGQRFRVRQFRRAVACVAVAAEGRTDRTATGARHRSHAGHISRHHDADRLVPLAFHAHLILRLGRNQPGEQRPQCREHLFAADRTAPQFEIHLHHCAYGGDAVQRAHILGRGIDSRHPLLAIVQIAKRLNSASGGTCPDSNQESRVLPHALDAFPIFRCRDAAFDKCDVHLRLRVELTGLGKVNNVHQFCNLQQLLSEIQERELAAIAGAELVDRYPWFFRHVKSLSR